MVEVKEFRIGEEVTSEILLKPEIWTVILRNGISTIIKNTSLDMNCFYIKETFDIKETIF